MLLNFSFFFLDADSSRVAAAAGLDDVRDFYEQNGSKLRATAPLPVYLSRATFEEVSRRFR